MHVDGVKFLSDFFFLFVLLQMVLIHLGSFNWLHSLFYLFHDGGRYHIETSPFISTANQWTDFYMIKISVMKELRSHTFMTSTRKGDGGFLTFITWLGILLFKNNRSDVHFYRGRGWGRVTKLVIFSGCH